MGLTAEFDVVTNLSQLEMASMVAKATSSSCASQMSPLASAQEKGSRNKRKFRADPPLGDPNKGMPMSQNECMGYEFSAEKYDASSVHGQSSACDLCGVNQDHSDGLKLDLVLASAIDATEVGPSQSRERLELEESYDADWSDLTESELEELVLSNLDAIFKSAIKKIVACGYTEEVASNAVLRSGLCYGCKDTVSNIVENTLAFLKNGQEIDSSREHYFEDLQQMEKYILAELVCILREVRPFFSTGDAMWCLLICDMNVSHACAIDGDPLKSLPADETPNGTSTSTVSSQSEMKTDAKCSELNPPSPSKSVSSVSSGHSSQPEANTNAASAPSPAKQKNTNSASGLVSEKEGLNSAVDNVEKPFTGAGTSQSHVLEEKFVVSRKVYSGSSKRECLLRQKSLHLEKNYRMYGSKGSRKLSGFGGLILDKKLRSVSESTSVSIKNASLRLSKAMGVDMPQDIVGQSPIKPEPCPPASVSSETPKGPSSLSKASVRSAATPSIALPAMTSPPALSAADTELSLSLPTKSNLISVPACCNPEVPYSSFPGIAHDKSLVPWYPQDKKDDCIAKLLPRVRDLQNQLQEWTEWANQKVMQAARRLGRDKAELKSLRQEKEEVERLKKEKQTLEENTMKKLTEMENALCKAGGQFDKANSAVRKLEVENAALRQEMEVAKLRAAKSASSCQEASKREKKLMMKFQSWEKQKTQLQGELVMEKRKVQQLLQEVEVAKQLQEQQEARWRQEEKAKDEMLLQASSLRKEREDLEASTKSKEDMIKLKSETNLQKYKDDIQKLEREISQLRLKTDSSKIAALRRGIDGSYTGRLADGKTNAGQKDSWTKYISELVSDLHDLSDKGVKRERECVMCLSEEMSVVFLPCAHQVVCSTCNELHEKQGMKDCPSCRGPIHRRIPVRYARS